jgi:hypothetical protein
MAARRPLDHLIDVPQGPGPRSLSGIVSFGGGWTSLLELFAKTVTSQA